MQIINKNKSLVIKFASNNIIFFNNPLEVINNTDCVMTDAWVSMGEKNTNKKKNKFINFQVNDKLMKKAKKEAIFMHCMPIHRNEEVTDSIVDGNQSVIWRQAENRMFVQQSILNYCIN